VQISGFGSANIADAFEAARADVAWLMARLDEFVDRYGREHQEAMQAVEAERDALKEALQDLYDDWPGPDTDTLAAARKALTKAKEG
jgi:hypothetical protein